MVQQLSGCLDILTSGFQSVYNGDHISHVIAPQPCFAAYYTPEMIDTYLRPEVSHREEVRQGLFLLYEKHSTFDAPTKTYFTVEGLHEMVETGKMADLPSQFAIPFTIPDRIKLLTLLRKDIQDDFILSRVINTSNLTISSFATTQLYKNHELAFYATTNHGIVSCRIQEKSICNAFYEFFESLPESKLVYSKEDTIEVLDELIALLNVMNASVCTSGTRSSERQE